MTGPTPHEPLDDQERELARVLRALPGAEPSAGVDQRILRAAANAAASTRRPVRRWLAVGSAGWGIGGAAAAVLALGVGWHILDPARQAAFQESAPVPAAESRDDAVTVTLGEPRAKAPSQPAVAPAAPAVTRPVPKPRDVTSLAAPAPAIAPAAPPPPPPVAAAPRAEPQAMGTVDAMVIDRAQIASEQQRVESDAMRDQAMPESNAAAGIGQPEDAMASRQEKSADLAPATRTVAMTPTAWLAKVRALRATHRESEAAASLRRFRAFYPHYAIPADLLPLLRE